MPLFISFATDEEYENFFAQLPVIPDEFEDLEDTDEEPEYEGFAPAYDEDQSYELEIDEPCSNCGSYSHWSDDCKKCEDCKRMNCLGDDTCDAICMKRYA